MAQAPVSQTHPPRRRRSARPHPAAEAQQWCRIRRPEDRDPDPFFRCAFDEGFDRGLDEDVLDLLAAAERAWTATMADYPLPLSLDLRAKFVGAYVLGLRSGMQRRKDPPA